MKKLTDEQKRDYIDNFGTRCPYCDSEEIEGGSWDLGVGQFWQNIVCHTCKKEWTDIYTLTAVEEYEE